MRAFPNDDGELLLEPGEYGKHPANGKWYARPFNCEHIANLAAHSVIEHEDGTITVSPSILITPCRTGEDRAMSWHGFLEKGVWREC
jgi:hypothetical protein